MEDGKDLTTRYIELMKAEGCRYACRDGYIFDTSAACARGEFERRMTVANLRDTTQVLRYLAKVSYADMSTIMCLARMFAKEKSLPNVSTDQDYVGKLIGQLVNLGAVCSRVYRDERDVKDKKFNCFCLTDRGAALFKEKTEYAGYIEEMLICKNETEVMRRLTANYILTKFAPRIIEKGRDVLYCRTEKYEKGSRRVVYGSVEDAENLTVFEPVFYHRNIKVQTEEELCGHIKARQEFLKGYLQNVGDKKRKTIVLIVEDKSYVKKAYVDYEETIKVCDLVFVTHEVAVSAYQGEGTPPFLRVIVNPNVKVDPNKEGGMKLVAETPPFLG